MATTLAAPPLQTPLFNDPKDGLITRVWNNWLLSLTTRIQTSATLLASASLTAQTASIPATNFALGSIAAGLYRVSWCVRVTTAASVSSSLTVTFGYTDSGVSVTQSGAALTTNSTTLGQSGTLLLRSDQASPITYAVTYASAGTPMAYKVDVVCEQVN